MNTTAAENKLKSERQRHEQQEHEQQRQAQIQTELKERSLQEANLKFTSLQQHYKLLKSQLEDFKEECSKAKTTQTTRITSLENQIKELQKTKDNGTNVWKVMAHSIRPMLEQRLRSKSLKFWHFFTLLVLIFSDEVYRSIERKVGA